MLTDEIFADESTDTVYRFFFWGGELCILFSEMKIMLPEKDKLTISLSESLVGKMKR